ncbi:type I-E CRISPR-associated protein Cse1/CasA [Actinomadura fibrosa]|uniref:Type I-E CRISPR-associated protein Cse1/CasA n=1 Tax=Actinomadura fibrosa TaxID=111802 RepID=A0ABW2XHI5_9ACTN|nr:type I-E CRISPR-associated protein Cse1/CasA [Actinomadura fibrosa]
MPAFDLVTEAWLRARFGDSPTPEPVGLRDVLHRAGEITEIAVDLPTQWPALMRQVLLPVVVHALGAPATHRAWADRFTHGTFTEAELAILDAYLEEHRPRFDLFHPETPFAQVADLHTVRDETKGAGLIVAPEATGNNVPLFSARTEDDPPQLTPAEAALWLLHAHCWDTAAIKTGAVGDPMVKSGKTTGNPTGPLGQLGVIMPVGRNLYETLLLNIPIGVQGRLGTPQWTRTITATWESRAAQGLLDLWTWQSRRIRLIPEQTPEGIRVPRVVVAAGDRLAMTPDWEPHTAWRTNAPAKTAKRTAKAAKPTPQRPLRHMPGKAIWRGMSALLAVEAEETASFRTSELLDQIRGLSGDGLIDEHYPLRAETFGVVYGNQSAIVEDVLHDMVPLPVAALRVDADVHFAVLEATEQAEQLAQALNYLSADLRRASGLDPIPWDKGQRPGERLLYLLDPVVRRLLRGLQNVPDEDTLDRGRLAWERQARRLALQVADSVHVAVPESVFAGRETRKSDGSTAAAYPLGIAVNDFYRRLDRILPRAADERRTFSPPEREAHP